MKKQIQTNADKGINRIFMIAKVLLSITPMIAYFYSSLLAMQQQCAIQDIFSKEPGVAVIFLIAMLNPYIAYLLHLIQKKLASDDLTFVLVNMIFLLVAQALTMNVFYFVMLLFVFYKAISYYHINVKETIARLRVRQCLYQGGGSMLVTMVSTLCLFASIRLM